MFLLPLCSYFVTNQTPGEDEAPTSPGRGKTSLDPDPSDLGFLQLPIATAHCGNECSNGDLKHFYMDTDNILPKSSKGTKRKNNGGAQMIFYISIVYALGKLDVRLNNVVLSV
ncbi:hypothetical protein L1987_21714 [Smallanthus sonchifolius]|uniref:Uncharacterized protein n=1 Tax=Smallanthus sonchifolius TaxID=185202 RepID=A0ACB9IFG6_9ASTR|nr:hypothetical protein L1987_21714 [Smallanthus sonchifolius]